MASRWLAIPCFIWLLSKHPATSLQTDQLSQMNGVIWNLQPGHLSLWIWFTNWRLQLSKTEKTPKFYLDCRTELGISPIFFLPNTCVKRVWAVNVLATLGWSKSEIIVQLFESDYSHCRCQWKWVCRVFLVVPPVCTVFTRTCETLLNVCTFVHMHFM